MKTFRKYLIVSGVVLLILIFIVPAVTESIRSARMLSNATHSSAAIRAAAFGRIGRRRYQPGLSAVMHALSNEQNREVLERAGYAAARLEAAETVPLLQQRVASGPDDSVRAALITCVARASGRDEALADWFRDGMMLDEPWRRVGSAAALLELGEAAGGEALIGIMKGEDPRLRAFAYGKLRGVAQPMAEALGQPLSWPAGADEFVQSPDWPRFEKLWKQSITSSTIMDVWNRPDRTDDRWHEIGRVLRGREHVGYWLGLSAKPT
jgi:HEAT repeat protein